MSQSTRALRIQREVADNIDVINHNLAQIENTREVIQTALTPLMTGIGKFFIDAGELLRAFIPAARAFSEVAEHLAKLITQPKNN